MFELKERKLQTNFEKLQQDSTDVSVFSSSKPKYGNMIVLFKNRKHFFLVGPNYCCMIFGFCLFLFLEFITTRILLQSYNPIVGYVFGVGGFVQLISYLAVGVSDPGILTKDDLREMIDRSSIKKYCKLCNLQMPPKTFHCKECDVCIKGYDHHCVWSSKCIGEKNLCKFYLFCGLSLLYMALCIIFLLMLW